MSEYRQIFDTISIGLIVLDLDFKIVSWNRWMELHTGFKEEAIKGQSIYTFYPNLSKGSFNKIIKSVIAFGNYASYSQKLHKYLIPLKNPHGSKLQLPYMQQNCTFGPLRDQDNKIDGVYITINDVTDVVVYEQKLVKMTKEDGLTGLYNRRYLDRRLAEELERSCRYGSTLSLMILDIDFFKNINDTHGHLCGDHTLRQFSKLLQKLVRNTDILGRYGGEEFCCILPGTPLKQAITLAERCRHHVEQTVIVSTDHHIKLTTSVGITESIQGDSVSSLIKRADDALYLAKRRGRNQVVSSPEVTTGD